MTQEVANFTRFYALLGKLPYEGDREELKKQIVRNCTDGRTESLRELTREEYEVCCGALEMASGRDEQRRKLRDELRKRRSACLKLMQQMGIDTTDWARVDDFCRNPRISGKAFRDIGMEELEALAVKLRAIRRRGGLKAERERKNVEPAGVVSFIRIDPHAPKN